MSATASEDTTTPPRPRAPGRGRRLRHLACLPLLATLCLGCAEEPLPERKLTREDCLEEVRMDRLGEALQRCNKVVAAFPTDPTPLNERYLLHTLAGEDAAACRDVTRAMALASRIPAAKLDAALRSDLKLRMAACRS